MCVCERDREWEGCVWGRGVFVRWWATPKETIFSKNRESEEEGQMQSTAGRRVRGIQEKGGSSKRARKKKRKECKTGKCSERVRGSGVSRVCRGRPGVKKGLKLWGGGSCQVTHCTAKYCISLYSTAL